MLLIAGDWQFRALVRAQLIETGYEVIAFPRLDVALAYLMRGPWGEDGDQLAATIVDLTELDTSLTLLVDLWQLTDQAPLLLCGGILDRTLLQSEKLPPAHVLRRPFSVGDVVNEVWRIDRWSSSKAAGA